MKRRDTPSPDSDKSGSADSSETLTVPLGADVDGEPAAPVSEELLALVSQMHAHSAQANANFHVLLKELRRALRTEIRHGDTDKIQAIKQAISELDELVDQSKTIAFPPSARTIYGSADFLNQAGGGRNDSESVPLDERLKDAFSFKVVNNPPDIGRLLEKSKRSSAPGEFIKVVGESLRDILDSRGVSVENCAEDAQYIFDRLTQAGFKIHEMDKPVPALPNEAPEIYGGLRGLETPPEFVKRVYAPWLGHGLDRAHIKHLDPKLYTAIDNWTRKPGNEWPADVDLPTRGEQTRRTIEQLKQEAPDGRIGKVLGDFTAREAQRIRAAVRRQEKKR